MVFLTQNIRDCTLVSPSMTMLMYLISFGTIIAGVFLLHTNSVPSCYQGECSGGSDDDNVITIASGPCGLDYMGQSSSNCQQYCGNLPGINCVNRDYDCDTMVSYGSYYCTPAISTSDPKALILLFSGLTCFAFTTFVYVWFSPITEEPVTKRVLKHTV